jgi:hypothetical protein
MSFLLVPQQVTDTTAEIWVGATDENVNAKFVKLEFNGDDGNGAIELNASEWQEWRSYRPEDRYSYLPWEWVLGSRPRIRTLHYQRVPIKSLKPRTSYSLRLRVAGQTVAGLEKHLREGRVTTLPAALPTKEEKPFTILLGSCFYGPEDPDGMVGTTYHYIPERERPDVKVLCGDQVYLDNPWRETTLDWYRALGAPGLFRAMLFKKYEDTWKQVRGEDAGFRQLLKDGANYFCSDDHEFWNNAPSFGGVGLVNTLTPRQRKWWFEQATELFRAFQSPSSLVQFEVGPLSVCIADTRINRDATSWTLSTDRKRFMRDGYLEAVGRWIRELKGPGVLVVGQLVLARKTGRLSFDRGLPDYEQQYEKLIEYIRSSPHSIVVLTGDVHFGRLAHGELRPGSENKFVEVVSSPMQAVLDGKGESLFGTYKEAPTEHFSKLESRRVTNKQNHFATLEFSLEEGNGVNMKAKYWPILRPDEEVPPRPQEVCETSLP